MLQTLTASQAVEAMVEHVRHNLSLQDIKEHQRNKSNMTFTGRGISDESMDVPFALEVVIRANKALGETHFEKALEKRRHEKIFTGILFPKSIDYGSSSVHAETPYFNQARLMPEMAAPDLKRRYIRFGHNDVKDLSRLEWAFAIPIGGSKVAYYNPAHGTIQVHEFQRFERGELIPDNRSLDQRYLWRFLKSGYFPRQSDKSTEAETFRGIQEGLHDRVRRIINTEMIPDKFTLQRYKGGTARLQKYEPQMSLFAETASDSREKAY